MKPHSSRIVFLVIFCLSTLLIGCGASKDPTLYILNPVPFKSNPQKNHAPLRIGINTVTLPEYLDHPQFIIFNSSYQGQLIERHQWAESLTNNVKRVIQANLTQQLKNCAVQPAPWDADFHPQYHLRVDILQFKIDTQGNSLLQAIYYIENDKQTVRHYQIELYEKLPLVNPSTMVLSMNRLLMQLTTHIVRSFRSLPTPS